MILQVGILLVAVPVSFAQDCGTRSCLPDEECCCQHTTVNNMFPRCCPCESRYHAGKVVGSVVCVIAFLLVLLLAVCCCRRVFHEHSCRRSRTTTRPSISTTSLTSHVSLPHIQPRHQNVRCFPHRITRLNSSYPQVLTVAPYYVMFPTPGSRDTSNVNLAPRPPTYAEAISRDHPPDAPTPAPPDYSLINVDKRTDK